MTHELPPGMERAREKRERQWHFCGSDPLGQVRTGCGRSLVEPQRPEDTRRGLSGYPDCRECRARLEASECEVTP